MFEDLERFLKDNHKLAPHDGARDQAEDLADMLKARLGGKAQVQVIKESELGLVDTDKLSSKFEGIGYSVIALANVLKVKLVCTDSKGAKLKAGDNLICTNGSKKKVLVLGMGFCILSRTNTPTAEDGIWFEHEIKKLKFVKE